MFFKIIYFIRLPYTMGTQIQNKRKNALRASVYLTKTDKQVSQGIRYHFFIELFRA